MPALSFADRVGDFLSLTTVERGVLAGLVERERALRRGATLVRQNERGTDLFESPPTHQFEVGRYREETMAFPPSVTVKDFTWGGSAGYPNAKPGAQPTHFPTVLQIVPVLPDK